MTTITPDIAARHGLSMNQNNGIYRPGVAYGIERKLEIAGVYQRHKEENQGGRPNISDVAAECRVSTKIVRKIESELHIHGRVMDPRELPQNRHLGPGIYTIDELDSFILLMLYLEEPSRTLASYKHHLQSFTGREVSKSTISRFFNHAFPIKGGLRQPNLVPYDKFKPENFLRAQEYVNIILQIAPARVHFGDEKLLKGAEFFCRKNRRNVLTGEVPPVFTSSDFRNTYVLNAFCGIDTNTIPLYYRIHDGTNDADSFDLDVQNAIAIGHLSAGKVLVLDNATYHGKGDNKYLADWLWRCFGIYVIYLPTRTPEWNVVEDVWLMLVRRMQYVPLSIVRQYQTDAVAHVADHILSEITHSNILGFYAKKNLIQLVD
jgi:hypothetical protein